MFPLVTLAEEANSDTKKKSKNVKAKPRYMGLTDDASREWMYIADVFSTFLEESSDAIKSSTMSEATQFKSLHCYAAREVLGIASIRHDAAGRAAYERAMCEEFEVKPYSVNSALWCRRSALSSRSTR
jgi:hypothetical protein